MYDLRGEALRPTVRSVVQLVDLGAESAADTQAERLVQVAAGRVRSSQSTLTAEVAPDSEFRLAWLRVEGWRAQLRKGGDVVERARWAWKMEDLVAVGARARRASIPDIVACVPSSMKGSVRRRSGGGGGGGNHSNAVVARSKHGSTKSVRWLDGA